MHSFPLDRRTLIRSAALGVRGPCAFGSAPRVGAQWNSWPRRPDGDGVGRANRPIHRPCADPVSADVRAMPSASTVRPRPGHPIKGRPEGSLRRDQHAGRGKLDPLARAARAVPDGRRSGRELSRDQGGRRPSSTSSPSSSLAPTGITATPACRKRWACMARSSSIPPGPIRSPMTASM